MCTVFIRRGREVETLAEWRERGANSDGGGGGGGGSLGVC